MTGTGLDPVRAGLIESLAHPGGNVTGLTTLNTELAGKRLELFKEAVPKLVRLAVLYNPANPGASREVKEDVPVAAQVLGLNVRNWEMRALEDFDKAFAALSKERPDGLYGAGSCESVLTNIPSIKRAPVA
jgi:putative ABC transport system substrate-binding protein